MRVLADFVLDSDLCLKPESGPLTLNGPDGSFALTLSNAEHDQTLKSSVLSAQLIFDTPSFENVKTAAIDKLSVCLNSLTYATNRKFASVVLKRIIDWTPGTIDRRALIYKETPEWDIAEPALDPDFMHTAERLLAMSSGAQAAMRWYRRAIGANVIDDQFSYFWFALEIVAETLKGAERVPSKCPHCQSALFCEKCNTHPTHRRYPGEAIQQTIQRVHPQTSDEIFSTLQTIRHSLMHGGRISSVIDKLPCDEQQAVNKLASITWSAISLMFDSQRDPALGTPIDLGLVSNITRRTLIASVDVSTRMPGDQNDPQLQDFPKFDLTVQRTSRK